MKQTKKQLRIQIAKEKFVKKLNKLSDEFEKETKMKWVINYKIEEKK